MAGGNGADPRTGEQRFLDAAIRAGDWYIQQQHLDGGFPSAPPTSAIAIQSSQTCGASQPSRSPRTPMNRKYAGRFGER